LRFGLGSDADDDDEVSFATAMFSPAGSTPLTLAISTPFEMIIVVGTAEI